MWKITDDKTLAGCHRWRAGHAAEVGVVWQGKDAGARFGGLQNSHSVWGSPLASAAICGRRSREVNHAVSSWSAAGSGHAVSLGTFTLRHHVGQSLTDVWDTVSAAWKGVTGTAAWRGKSNLVGDRDRYGIAHHVRAAETTHGRNGWHVHLHVLLFHERLLTDAEQAEMSRRLFSRWSAAAERAGFEAPTEKHGIDLVHLPAEDEVAGVIGTYVTKGMLTGLSAELTTGQIAKDGRNGNRTPFAILRDIGTAMRNREDYSRDLALWHEWEAGSKGRRQLTWSRGAKEALGVDVMDDADIDDSQDDLDDAETVAGIDAETWRDLAGDVRTRLRILDAVAEATTPDEARRYARLIFDTLGIAYRPVSVKMTDAGDDLGTHAEATVRDLHRHVLEAPGD